MLTVFIVVTVNGLTFSLIAILVGFLNYINENARTITPAIEVLFVLILVIIMTSICFRQLSYWIGSMFIPKLNTKGISDI